MTQPDVLEPDHIYSLVAHLPIRNHFRVTEDSKHPEDRDGLIWALRMRNLVHQAEPLKRVIQNIPQRVIELADKDRYKQRLHNMALAKFAYGALSVACSTLSTAADLELQSQHAKDALLPSARLQYWPSEGVRPKIRLLTIIPGGECDSVPYKLSTEQLEVAPQYEALSYAWGSSQDNLTRCLDLWRNDSEYLWIDALCINQSDSAKRTRAIRSISDCHEPSTHEQERGHMSKRLETDALEDACRVLLDNYQWRKMPTHSIFLKLHIWMTVSAVLSDWRKLDY